MSLIHDPQNPREEATITEGFNSGEILWNAINTHRLDRMSVGGGGQVKLVLLGYTRYVLASSCAVTASELRRRRSAHIYRIGL